MIQTAGRSTLVDDTADKIRKMIFDGTIEPGELLPHDGNSQSNSG